MINYETGINIHYLIPYHIISHFIVTLKKFTEF